MKKALQNPVCLFLLFWLFYSLPFQSIQAQEQAPEFQHFQLGIAIGGSIIYRNTNVGFGMGASIEPRYFINQKIAIVGRAQSFLHINVVAEPGIKVENDISSNSYLAGVLVMDRGKRNPFFWGVNTGFTVIEEVIGVDDDGYAIMGDPVSYWALQPRLGACLGKFEAEFSYHFATSSYARFAAVSIGFHFWGKKKKETNNY